MTREREVLLALDYGTRRIGVASANLLTRTASPVTTLVTRGEPPWDELDRLIAEWTPARLIVGFPGSETDSDIGEAVAAFIAGLRDRYGLPVESVDETLTSADARSTVRAARASGALGRRVPRGRIDQRAACLIAEQWLHEVRDDR